MKVIGFTEQYYTLWEVGEPYKVYYDKDNWHIKVDTWYLQNLSKDFDQAKAKLNGQQFEINLELRGTQGARFSSILSSGTDLTPAHFSFGRYKGELIMETSEIFQLRRAMIEEPNPRTRVYARRRLIELGELQKVESAVAKIGERIYGSSSRYYNWKQIDRINEELNAPVSSHYEVNGSRITLKVKEIKSFGFETQFGWTTICVYADEQNRAFKYKGAAPANVSKDEFVTIQATVEHGEYKGENETRLKRIKILTC